MFDKFNQGRTALIIAILLVVFFFVYQGNDDNLELIYKGKLVEITQHAECRMGCRKVSKLDVQKILEKGKINDEKSEPNARFCPKYVLEGTTKNKEALRIVVADCDAVVKLVTVIDLKNDYDCDCK